MAADVSAELPEGFALDELPPGFTPDPVQAEPRDGVERGVQAGLIRGPEANRKEYEAAQKAKPRGVLDFLMGAPRQGQEESTIGSAVRKGLGVAEAVISKLTGATTGLASGAVAGADNVVKQVGYRAGGLDTSKLPSPGEAFAAGADAATYSPRTETGQEILESDAVRQLDNTAMALGPNPGALGVQGMRTAQLTKAATTPKALARVDKALQTAKLEAPVNEGIANAIEAGYKLTPKAGNAGAPAKLTQTAAGSARLEQGLSAHNSKITAKLAREDIGLADDVPLTREATAKVREEAGADYQAVKDVGRIELDGQLAKDLDRVAEPYIQGGKDFDQLAKNPIIATIDGLKRTDANTSSIVEVVKDLRNKADVAFRGGDKKLGVDYRATAQALDNAMDRALGRIAEKQGDPALADAVTKYREARVRIAKTYLLDDAMLGKPGEVNAMVYGRAAKKGAKLDGPAKQIADFATHFGDEGLAKPAGKSGHVGATYHDIVLGALLHGGKALLSMGARPGARAALGSEWMQRRMAAKARKALPPEGAPEPVAPTPEPTLERGFEPSAAEPAAPQPLGDLTPDWETAPGASAPAALEVVPTEGLVPAVGEAAPMRLADGPARVKNAGSEIPAVPGRPDLPDAVITGRPAEAAGDARTGAAMLEPGAQEAMRQQQVARNVAAAKAETPKKIPAGEATEIKPQVVEPAGSPKVKEPPAEKIPVGEATEIKPETGKTVESPKADARLAEVERLKAATDSPVVRKALDERATKIKAELKEQADAEQRRNDAAELRRTAALTEDPEIKAALFEKAKAIEKADAIPAGKTTEGQPEIKADAPKKIPTGKAKELSDVPEETTKQKGTSTDEGKGTAVPDKKGADGKTSEGETLADIGFPQLDEAFMEHQQRAQRAAEPAPEPAVLERGRRQTREAIEKGVADGSLGKDEGSLALWALDKNPNLARGLRTELADNKKGDIARAVYKSAERIVEIFKNRESTPDRAAHEILHHTERMMPPEIQRGIRREWRRALDAAIEKASPAEAKALRSIEKGISGGQEAFEEMKAAFKSGVLDRDKHYALTNPSEYWAVNASRILSERHTGRNAWRTAAVRYVKDMVEHVKGAVGMRSDAPILKALDDLLDIKKNAGVDRSTSTLKTAESQAMVAKALDAKPTKQQRREKYREATK